MLESKPLYRIVDAQSPSRVGHLAVNPNFPLMALMLGGSFAGWAWFVFNAIALGSYTRRREIAVCTAATVGVPAAGLGLGYAMLLGWLGSDASRAFPYCQLALTTLKLSAGYFVATWQMRAAALREHYESPLRNGFFVLAAVTVLRFVLEPHLATRELAWLKLFFLM
jgi:hypothetical protein